MNISKIIKTGKLLLVRKATLSLSRVIFPLLVIFSILPWAQPVFGSALSDLATSMQPGTWAALTTTGFNNGAVMKPPAGGSILEYTDKAGSWNAINGTILVLGGAHASFSSNCNETMFARYTESSNTWINTMPNPCPTFDTAFSGGIGHDYHHDTIVPSTGDYYHRQYYSGKVMKFSHASQAWSQCSVIGGPHQVAGALEYFPDRNSLVFLDGDWGIWELSLASGNCNGTWVQRASTKGGGFTPQLTGLSSYHNQSRYSSKCNCVIMGGGNGSRTLYRYNSNGTFSAIADAPVTISMGGNGTIFTVDPVTGLILVWSYADAPTTMYQYDPSTNVWATITRTSPIFPGPEGGVTETIAVPISTYGVIMFVQAGSSSGGSVYLYKHAAGSASTPPPSDTAAPSIPTGVSAVASSSSQINLSWTASTDNVGVTGYRIFRQGTQIASATGTSYQDTGLSPATTYSYTVAAHDLAGNVSSPSVSTSATTLTASALPPPSSGSVITLVDFGSSSASNVFGLAGWSTVIKDRYTDYQNIGPGGTTIVVGNNYSYNYQGVTGTARSFLSGDTITVTWYNNSASSVTFAPNISFTDLDRITAGATGTWYPMRSVSVPPFGSATSVYTFNSSTAGSYSLVNVNANYSNTMVVIADKIEMVPGGSSSSSFDFSISNGGNQSVTQGQSASNNIGASLLSGTAQSVIFSTSALPTGAVGSFSLSACTPNCSTSLSISTSPSTPTGSYPITVTASSGGTTKTSGFTLTVTATTSPPSGAADFQTRCAAPGVIRCFSFDTNADLGQTSTSANYGRFNNSDVNCVTALCPTIDTAVKASGAGSLKFTQPAMGSGSAAGQWYTNFSPDLLTQIGNGQTVVVQWRQRFNSDMLRGWPANYGNGLGGFKQAIISEGMQPNGTNPSSNTSIETVMNQAAISSGYGVSNEQFITGYTSGGAYGFQFNDGTQIRMQTLGPPYCYYPNDPQHGCLQYYPNEWMTFKIRIDVGTFGTASSRVRYWAAREAQPSILFIDSNISHGVNGFTYPPPDCTGCKFGKVWLLPYISEHKTDDPLGGITWYDELIISTQDIADPSSTNDSGQPPTAPSSLTLK